MLGDGPAGSMAALVLARRGRRTLMVDRIREHGAKAGEVLPGIAVAQLRAVGQEALLDSRKHLAVVGGSSSWGHAGIVDRDSHFGPHGNSWHLDRGIFDAELCAAASSRGAAHRAGVRFRRAHELSDGRGWKVELAGLGEVTCSFVVDATGRASSFARSRGVRRRRRDRLVAVTTTAQIASDFEFTIEAAVGGWWYAAALPAGRVVVTYLTDADLIPAGVESRSIFFNDKLDETVHISSRISIQPDARIQVVTAQTESLDAPAGGGWVAVGDAAASFDPLSSLGLTNALETGRLAGLAIDAALAGQEQPIEAYGRYVRQRAQVSDILRSAYYGMETRWPRSPFWDRRRRWVI